MKSKWVTVVDAYSDGAEFDNWMRHAITGQCHDTANTVVNVMHMGPPVPFDEKEKLLFKAGEPNHYVFVMKHEDMPNSLYNARLAEVARLVEGSNVVAAYPASEDNGSVKLIKYEDHKLTSSFDFEADFYNRPF